VSHKHTVTLDRLQWYWTIYRTGPARFQLTQTRFLHTHPRTHVTSCRWATSPSQGTGQREKGRLFHAHWFPLFLPARRVLVEVVFAATSNGAGRAARVRDSLHFNCTSLTVCFNSSIGRYSVARETAGLRSPSLFLCSRHLTTNM